MTEPDGIPVKILKIARNVIKKTTEDPKTTLVVPIYKKNDRDKIENNRPVSILNCFSNVYER